MEAFCCHTVEALLTIQQIGSLIPYVTQLIDVESLSEFVFLNRHGTLICYRLGYLCISYAMRLHNLIEELCLVVRYLNKHTRVLCKEGCKNILALEVAEVNLQTAFSISKAHLKQSCDDTTGTDVVACEQHTLVNQLLYGREAINEIFRILNRRNIASHLAKTLCKCATAELHLVEREVDIVYCRVGIIDKYRRNHLANIAHLATSTHDNGSWRDNLVTTRILLGHRQGVLASRNVDSNSTTEVRQSLYRRIETRIFTLL